MAARKASRGRFPAIPQSFFAFFTKIAFGSGKMTSNACKTVWLVVPRDDKTLELRAACWRRSFRA
jgi:hypothetical protein